MDYVAPVRYSFMEKIWSTFWGLMLTFGLIRSKLVNIFVLMSKLVKSLFFKVKNLVSRGQNESKLWF